MTDSRVASIGPLLVSVAGGYLRNVGNRPGTCATCRTPTRSMPRCSQCEARVGMAGLPDALGFMIYAGFLDPIHQAGRVMWDYKNPSLNSKSALGVVGLLAALGLTGHVACLTRVVGTPVDAWATVPSLPPKPERPHPLNLITERLSSQGSIQVQLQGTSEPVNPRSVSADHFTVTSNNAGGRHVLLIDDTWTSGGHALSATLALRAAGADHVSVLVLARWLTLGWEATTQEWARAALSSPDFDPEVCPWTQGACP